MDLNELKDVAAICTQCDLHKGRITPVFSKGNPDSKIMICGMCPGPDENKKGAPGLPFVGRAGKLLDEVLYDCNLDLENVYITNIVKCFIKPGIQLSKDWVEPCLPYILSEIVMIKPKIILTLGADASKFLLSMPEGTPLGFMRERIFNYSPTVKIIATYHPSYLTRGGGKDHKHYYRILDDFYQAMEVANV